MSDTPSMDTNESARLTLTVRQFASQMQVSMPTAYVMVNQPGFPAFKAGKKILISRTALEKWIDEQVCREEAREQCRNSLT